MLNIHTALPEDAPEIARLNKLFNGVDEPADNYARRIRDAQRVDTPILAEIDGRVIGLANLRLLPPVFYSEMYAELTELFVEEGFRHHGTGRALVSYAEELALAGCAPEMIILTDFYNGTAQALYRRMGYEHRDIALSKSLGQAK
jgi:GNAT superfamily N-acetyltransferase